MNTLIPKIKIFTNKLINLIYTVYCNLVFLFNKQKTLQKIYRPIIVEKINERDSLNAKLASVTVEIKQINNTVQKIENESLNYIRQIKIIQELLLKK